MAFDPLLVGSWKPKGAAANFPTYRVDAAGHYFAAFPAQPISYQASGTKLNWGGVLYTKLYGTPGTLPGIWTGDSDGDELNFRADGTVTIHAAATEEYFGNYELQNSGNALWYEEFRSTITITGARITFDPPYATNQPYDYAVAGEFWTLYDVTTAAIVFEYEKL